jgi:hypothetical protein
MMLVWSRSASLRTVWKSSAKIADYRVPRFEGWPKELNEAVVPFRTPSGRPIPGSQFRVGERAFLDLSVQIVRGEFVFATVALAVPQMGEVDLVFVPMTGLPQLRSALVWRRRVRDPKLREFLGVARGVLQGSGKRATRGGDR